MTKQRNKADAAKTLEEKKSAGLWHEIEPPKAEPVAKHGKAWVEYKPASQTWVWAIDLFTDDLRYNLIGGGPRGSAESLGDALTYISNCTTRRRLDSMSVGIDASASAAALQRGR